MTETPVRVYDLFFPVVWEMDSTGFYNTNVYGCNVCHIRHNFPVVYLTPHYVANIFCKMFCLLINNNLIYSVDNKSGSISGIIIRELKIFVYIFYKFRCCAGRNSNVTTAMVNPVFLVTFFLNFACDIPFRVSDINE